MFDRWSPVGCGRTWNFKGLKVYGKCFRESCSSDNLKLIVGWFLFFLFSFLLFSFDVK